MILFSAWIEHVGALQIRTMLQINTSVITPKYATYETHNLLLS